MQQLTGNGNNAVTNWSNTVFKSIFTFIKSLFTSAENLTGVVDNAVHFSLLHTETWVKEAYAENQKKSEELNIDEEALAAKLKAISKSQNH